MVVPGKGGYVTLVVYMPTTVGNEANYKTGTEAPEISLGVTLVSTQTPFEKDSFGDGYDVNAPIDFVPVQNADEFVDAIANGKNVVLNNDIELPEQLNVSQNLSISGNGNKISAPVGGTRIVSADNGEDVTINLSNVDLSTDNSERCISIYGNNNVELVLDDCTATANKYAINIAGSNTNVDVTIKNSEITGWCAFQTWSAGTKATFENCTLVGNNTFVYNADGWNNFATIVINTDAPNTELTFTNCRFEANQTTGNKQYLLSVRAPGAKVTLTGCSYYADRAEIEDLSPYLTVYPEATDLQLTIDGNLITIQ